MKTVWFQETPDAPAAVLRSTVYGFPVAIGIAASWDIFVSNVMNTRSLFYWWMPDATFLQLDPSYIVLPPHSPIEWSQGNLRTAGSQNYITKLVSPEVRASAPSVRLFLQNMKLELGEIKQLLLEVANGRSTFDTVCNWVIANTGRWRQWIPVETNCEPGFGLQAADGSPASARDGATGCLLCPAGSFSERLVDDFGETYRCVPCPAGSHQNIPGKSDCLLCNPGYIAPEPGKLGDDIFSLRTNQFGIWSLETFLCFAEFTFLLITCLPLAPWPFFSLFCSSQQALNCALRVSLEHTPHPQG